MREGFKAGKASDWADFFEDDGLSAWSSVKLRECYNNLANGLKLLANQQQGGDSLVEVLVVELQGRSRFKMMDGLRRIMVDNHEAVKVGDLEKTQESRPVEKPKFTTDFHDPLVREGADELTLREGKKKVCCAPASTQRM